MSTKKPTFRSISHKFDFFRQPFFFNLPDNQGNYLTTTTGVTFSAVIVVTVLVYAGFDLVTLLGQDSSNVYENTIDLAFTEDYEFNIDKKPGLQVAFGLTAYDDDYEMLVVPEYVTLKARMYGWNEDEDGSNAV